MKSTPITLIMLDDSNYPVSQKDVKTMDKVRNDLFSFRIKLEKKYKKACSEN